MLELPRGVAVDVIDGQSEALDLALGEMRMRRRTGYLRLTHDSEGDQAEALILIQSGTPVAAWCEGEQTWWGEDALAAARDLAEQSGTKVESHSDVAIAPFVPRLGLGSLAHSEDVLGPSSQVVDAARLPHIRPATRLIRQQDAIAIGELSVLQSAAPSGPPSAPPGGHVHHPAPVVPRATRTGTMEDGAVRAVKKGGPPAQPRMYDEPLEPAVALLIDGQGPDLALELARILGLLEHPVLVLSRLPPGRLTEDHGLPRESCRWLTDRPVQDGQAIAPSLEIISRALEDFLRASTRGVAVIDGLEYLVSNHGFERTLDMLRDLTDLVRAEDHLLVLPTDLRALDSRRRELLRRELDPIDEGQLVTWLRNGVEQEAFTAEIRPSMSVPAALVTSDQLLEEAEAQATQHAATAVTTAAPAPMAPVAREAPPAPEPAAEPAHPRAPEPAASASPAQPTPAPRRAERPALDAVAADLAATAAQATAPDRAEPDPVRRGAADSVATPPTASAPPVVGAERTVAVGPGRRSQPEVRSPGAVRVDAMVKARGPRGQAPAAVDAEPHWDDRVHVGQRSLERQILPGLPPAAARRPRHDLPREGPHATTGPQAPMAVVRAKRKRSTTATPAPDFSRDGLDSAARQVRRQDEGGFGRGIRSLEELPGHVDPTRRIGLNRDQGRERPDPMQQPMLRRDPALEAAAQLAEKAPGLGPVKEQEPLPVTRRGRRPARQASRRGGGGSKAPARQQQRSSGETSARPGATAHTKTRPTPADEEPPVIPGAAAVPDDPTDEPEAARETAVDADEAVADEAGGADDAGGADASDAAADPPNAETDDVPEEGDDDGDAAPGIAAGADDDAKDDGEGDAHAEVPDTSSDDADGSSAAAAADAGPLEAEADAGPDASEPTSSRRTGKPAKAPVRLGELAGTGEEAEAPDPEPATEDEPSDGDLPTLMRQWARESVVEAPATKDGESATAGDVDASEDEGASEAMESPSPLAASTRATARRAGGPRGTADPIHVRLDALRQAGHPTKRISEALQLDRDRGVEVLAAAETEAAFAATLTERLEALSETGAVDSTEAFVMRGNIRNLQHLEDAATRLSELEEDRA